MKKILTITIAILFIMPQSAVALRPLSHKTQIKSASKQNINPDHADRSTEPVIQGRNTKMQTLKGRLKRIDPILVKFIRGQSGATILDVGIGYPPYTTLELADLMRREMPDAKVVGLDNNIPAAIVTTSFFPEGFQTQPTIIFNVTGELLTVSAIPLSYTAEQIKAKAPGLFEKFMQLKNRLLTEGNGKSYRDEDGNSIIVNPLSLEENKRPNIEYLEEDIFQLSLPAESVTAIRDFNTSRIYYTSVDEQQALLRIYEKLLQNEGYLFLGISAIFSATEEYMVYKKLDGRLIPHQFIFGVDPVRVNQPGAISGVSHSYFNEYIELYRDYEEICGTIFTGIPAEERADWFNQDKRDQWLTKITEAFNARGYVATIIEGHSISLTYKGENLKTPLGEDPIAAALNPESDSRLNDPVANTEKSPKAKPTTLPTKVVDFEFAA